MSYEPIVRNVYIVPVNGAVTPAYAPAIKALLDKVYAPAMVSWNVTVKANLQVDNVSADGFATTGLSEASRYTPDMNAVIKAWRKANNLPNKTVVLFFVKAPNSDKLGYMPLTGNYGFIFNLGSNLELLAHELAHGTFNLKHTFSEKAFWQLNGPAPRFAEGTTQNLMDYTNGTELWKYQWDLIHDPERIVLGALDEEEGAMLTMPLLQVNWTSSPPVTEGLFLSPGGMPIGLTGISELALLKSAESGIDARTVLKSVLYGFAKGEQRYFANFSGGRFTGYFLEGTISEKDVYTDTDGTTYNMIQAGRYDVTLLGIDAQAPTTRQVDNNLWYDQPDWNNYTAQGTQITIIDDYTFMPCGSLLREYKDSPLMESHVLKTAILKNPCVLKNPTLHFGGDVPESQWMKEFNMVFGTMLNVAFIPAIVEVGGVVLLEYGKQQLTKASIAAVLDMSLQSVCIYLEGDENMNMADVLYKIDYYQVAVSAGEGAIDNIYTDISVPLYDALMKDGRLKDELTPGDFLKDYALGVTINLLTRGITDGHFSKYYKRMVVAVKKGNLDNKLAKIGLSAENRKAFSDLMGGMTQKSLQRFEELKQKLRTFTVDGTATDLSRFADELDAVADHYPNKSIDELVAAFGCFTAATPVATPSGLRPIADIQTGDTVMSYNHTAQRTEPRVVANLKNYAAKALVILSLSTGQQIEATPTHPFFANGRYTPASQLAPGDTLTAPNGHKVLLQAVQPLDTVATVYNLTVAHNSNYFVGNPGVLVHNDCMMALLNAPIYKSLVDKLDKLTPELKAAFMADFEKAGKELLDVLNSPNGIEAWRHLSTFTHLRKDASIIKSMSNLMTSHADFFTENKDKITSIISHLGEAGAKCNTCPANTQNLVKPYMKGIDEHLDDIAYMLTHFGNVPGFSGTRSVINEMAASAAKADGGSFMLSYIRKHADDFKNIAKFEADFDDSKRLVDVLLEDGTKVEFKSWTPGNASVWGDFFSGRGNSYQQFLNYLKNTDDLSKLKYVFNTDKLGGQEVREAFKELLSNKKVEIFEALPMSTRERLLGVNNGNNFGLFESLIKDTQSKLYDFIF